MIDSIGRNIDYMRISVTDRCNLRCKYCMPIGIKLTEMKNILTFEEIIQIVKAAVNLGIKNFRITGGEPLVRNDIENLIKMIRDISGVKSISMTTNGILLKEKAIRLKEAGLNNINISLDTLNPNEFYNITGKDELYKVLEGIFQAKKSGLDVKINTVLRKETDWEELISFGEKHGLPVRFIEMMPIGYGKDFDYISNDILIKAIRKRFGDYSIDIKNYGNGPARYLQFKNLQIPVGFISAIDHSFCRKCNRIRLTSEGYLKLCLCFNKGVDLRNLLRSHVKDDELQEIMKSAIFNKPVEHKFNSYKEITEEKSMVSIGG
ncbi:MAG: GTP 3',8-cyclase MoaA [Lachnospiraceae bacterium]|nr:GTP 3',8-cyclase MoaA [Lachnospiraceae bacterium]